MNQTVSHVSILFDCENVLRWLKPFVFELSVGEWDVLFFCQFPFSPGCVQHPEIFFVLGFNHNYGNFVLLALQLDLLIEDLLVELEPLINKNHFEVTFR